MDKLNVASISIVIPTFNRKAKLIRLIRSLLESTFPVSQSDIIVVNDCSTDGTAEAVSKEFPDLVLINNKEEGYLAHSRNVGIKASKGKYVLLIDDDNVIDRDCIQELMKTFVNDTTGKLGVVGPMICYLDKPALIWCAGVRRNMTTSLTSFVGRGETDEGQYQNLIPSVDFPNSFMISREVIDAVGFFDDYLFPIHYDEADFGERVRRAGFNIVCNPLAKTLHDISLPTKADDKTRIHHLQNDRRAYYAGKNRVVFLKKYSSPINYFIFAYIFNWILTGYYLYIIFSVKNKEWAFKSGLARSYIRGIVDGMGMDVGSNNESR